MAFMIRSVTCIVDNQTDHALVLSSNKDVHGSLDTPIPPSIQAHSKGTFKSSTAGFMTGTEGWAVFEIKGAEVMFEVNWNNPFIGDNAFERALRPLEGGDVARFEALPAAGEDLQDADDVVVTFTLKMVPQEPVKAGGGGIAQAPPPQQPPPPPEAPQQVDAKPGATAHASAVGVLTPPRLSVALNKVKPDDSAKPDESNTDKSIDATLAIIAKRIEAGLDIVWKKGPEEKLWDPAKWKESDPEEHWARAITELLLGLPYNGSAAIYGQPNLDGIFYKPFADPAAEPIAPLSAACQHLTTFGVLSRGYTYKDVLETGFSCQEAGTMPLFKGGNWWSITKTTNQDKRNIAKVIELGLTPGSMYVFNPEPNSGKQRKGSHIAFVLRVDKDQKKAQFFDTGGLNVPERTDGPVPEIMQSFKSKGSYDEPLWEDVTTEPIIGMGIPKPAGDLTAAAARVRKARPIGFVRLVLAARGEKFASPIDKTKPPSSLLFVSRLLRMYGDAPEQNYPIARYFWSLRDLPNRNAVQAYWVFYAPIDVALGPEASPDQKAKKAYAKAVMIGPRTKKVDDFPASFAKDWYLVIGDMADGKATQIQRKFTEAKNNDAGSTGDAKSFALPEPPEGFPPNLHKLLSSLPPKESIAPSAPVLPALFKDYV
jgi:hypothetical protein